MCRRCKSILVGEPLPSSKLSLSSNNRYLLQFGCKIQAETKSFVLRSQVKDPYLMGHLLGVHQFCSLESTELLHFAGAAWLFALSAITTAPFCAGNVANQKSGRAAQNLFGDKCSTPRVIRFPSGNYKKRCVRFPVISRQKRGNLDSVEVRQVLALCRSIALQRGVVIEIRNGLERSAVGLSEKQGVSIRKRIGRFWFFFFFWGGGVHGVC